MSNFWQTEEPIQTTGTFETGGGDIDPIPAKTQVLAAPQEAKWDEYQGDDYISITWSVLKPEAYKNRKIFQKLRVRDSDPKKRDKAIRMLAAIDANAKGGMFASGEEPTDAGMQRALINKPMVLMLQVWEMETDNGLKKGNWISAVSPKSAGASTAKPAAATPPPPPVTPPVEDDDVPF